MIHLQYKEWKADLTPEYGMNTVCLTYEGEHILRNPAGEEEPGKITIYGTPLLLPPNRTAWGKFSFDGKEYQLPINEERFQNHIHGFLRFQPFTVTEQSENQVKAVFANRGEIFPFDFSVCLNYWLDDEGYHQEIAITNTGDCDMPLTFGIHSNFEEKPYFQVPLGKWYQINDHLIPTGDPVELTERQKMFRDGMQPDGGDIEGFYTSVGNVAKIGRMEYRVSENFNQWILYNARGNRGFISIEPQCGAVNSLNSGDGLHRLVPGETEVFSTLICVSE